MTASRPVYAWGGAAVASTIPLPELQPATAEPEFVLTTSSPCRGPEPDWYHGWPAADGTPWLSFGRTASGYLLRFHDQADVGLDPASGRIECDAATGADAALVRWLLLDQVLPLALSARGRFVFHASAVLGRAGAIAFTGSTGAGKSTLAAAFAGAGCSVLSDDALVVDGRRGEITAIGSYPVLRLWPEAARALGLAAARADGPKIRLGPGAAGVAFAPRAPLRAIVDVSIAPLGEAASIALCSGADRARRLMSQIFRLDPTNRSHREVEIDQLSAIAGRVTIAALRIPRGLDRLGEAVDLVSTL